MKPEIAAGRVPPGAVFGGQMYAPSGRVILTSPVALMIPCYVDVF
jgi:hypothetical protein